MKVAIVGAGFTAVEADQLRRAMATFKLTGGVSHFYDKLVERHGRARLSAATSPSAPSSRSRGSAATAFPKATPPASPRSPTPRRWMKHHHPDVFCAALLNAQPMGFYAPAQIVRDAREHGVEVRPVCINASRWDCTLEPAKGATLAVRLGFRQVRGLANVHGAAIVSARGECALCVASRRSGGAPACRARRSSGWPRPTRSTALGARSAPGTVEGARAWARRRCRCSPRPTSARPVQPGRRSKPTSRLRR